jgi:multiple sugar transport system permease protein
MSSATVVQAPSGAEPRLEIRETKNIASRRDTKTALLMAAPAIVGLLLFVFIPFVTAIYLSLNNVKLGSGVAPNWLGLEQYERILFNPDIRGDFLRGLANNMLFALIVVPLQTGCALGLALLLNRPLRGMAGFRTFFFMPVVFPMALVAVVWKLIYSRDDIGMLNATLDAISFGAINSTDWLGDPKTALVAIVVMSVWQGVGFQMVIILAALQGIPQSLYEAASIDKAGKFNQLRFVTIPQLRNTLIFVAMVTTIFAFRLFDQVYILTQGGPENATTTVMYQTVTTGFNTGNIGQASAMTVIFFLIVVAITLIQRSIIKEEREVA